MGQVQTQASPTTVPTITPTTSDDKIHCVTQHPRERQWASAEFLEVCDDNPVDVITSRNCVGTGCGGHPICAPCLELAREKGIVR